MEYIYLFIWILAGVLGIYFSIKAWRMSEIDLSAVVLGIIFGPLTLSASLVWLGMSVRFKLPRKRQ